VCACVFLSVCLCVDAAVLGMICTPSQQQASQLNGGISAPQSHEEMMATEDYYKPSEKVESMYNLNNNVIHHEANLNHLQPIAADKLSTNVLLQGIGEYKHAQNGVASNIDEQRALQLALELSMLGLTNEDELNYGDLRMKKSMNMTECVPVPSSEHVAEIVGRQGKFSIFSLFSCVFTFFSLAARVSCCFFSRVDFKF
jgi:hypothetical protein